jgi:hypothetical protein
MEQSDLKDPPERMAQSVQQARKDHKGRLV